MFGNDFERPLRDRLPPGFGAALRIVRWAIDPGLDGDPYADQPYLYGPLLSSVNVLRIGGKQQQAPGLKWQTPNAENGSAKQERKEEVVDSGDAGHEQYEVGVLGDGFVEEGAEGEDGSEWRRASGCPDGPLERQKWALDASEKEKWVWEQGRVYTADFFNGFIDFNEFALRLPGFSLGVLPYIGGKDDSR